jgi:hypothetical protein
VIEVLFQLLFLTALFVFLGEPLRAVALKRLEIFQDLDLIQKGILDIFFGGILLYLLALLPLGLFSWPIILGYTIFSIVSSIFLNRKQLLHIFNLKTLNAKIVDNKKQIYVYLSVIIIFLIFLSINLSSLNGLIFGSVRDESIHSLYTQVILQNQALTGTLQPYLPEGVIYPQAAHVIFAYSTLILNMDIPWVILYVSVLFKSLSIFGAYFLGKKLGNNLYYGLALSFVTAFISSWPLNVTWGANPFLIGFPFFLVCLGLLFNLYRKHNLAGLVVAGLMFGFTGAIILSYLQALIVITLLLFTYYIIESRQKILSNLASMATILIVSLIPLAPFLYQFITLYPYPGHNIGLPSDITSWASQQGYFNQAIDWAFNNLSPYFLPKILMMFLIGSFAVILLITKDYENPNDKTISISRFALAIFTPVIFLSFLSFFLPGDFNIISWGHQGIILSIPLSILIIASFLKFADVLQNGRFKPLAKVFPKNSQTVLVVIILLLSLITAPFLYYRFVDDSKTLRGAYDIYAVTTPQDYALMQWMKANFTSPDTLILVHPYSSGLFIPSVSNNKVIYPYTGSAMSLSYLTLVGLLENQTLNAQAYKIIRDLNVSYIFVSSNVVNEPPTLKWEPTLFLGNPNFEVTKNFGDSYLFRIVGYDSRLNFVDDFQYTTWDQNGWLNAYSGWGQGNVTLVANGVFGSKALVITSQTVPLVNQFEPRYTNWVNREFFVGNHSQVTLSFDLDATKGFHGQDTFALIISNLNQSQAIVIATPNNFFNNYQNTTTLQSNQGSFSLDISQLWQNSCGTPNPSTLILNLVNYDFDGIQNVVQIDNIKVTLNSTNKP